MLLNSNKTQQQETVTSVLLDILWTSIKEYFTIIQNTLNYKKEEARTTQNYSQ